MRIRIYVCAAVLLLACCERAPPDATAQPEEATRLPRTEPPEGNKVQLHSERGLVIYRWDLKLEGDQPVDLIVAIAEASHFLGRVRDLRVQGLKSDVLEQTGCNEPALVANGGFYALNEKGEAYPLGLVIEDGELKSEFSPRRYGGFLVLDATGASILPLSRQYDLAVPNALQTSPIIIKAGANDMLQDDGVRFDRTAVGSTRSGEIVVAGAFGRNGHGLSLYQFAESLLQRPELTDDPIWDMIAMDGGPSAHIYAAALDQHFGFEALTFVPNAVCLERRTGDDTRQGP